MVVGIVMVLALPLWAEEVQKIDINKASVEELMELKFVGPELAERIVKYREEHGPFERAENIVNVKGVGPKALEANKDRITVE
jgi:competence protein ComEA